MKRLTTALLLAAVALLFLGSRAAWAQAYQPFPHNPPNYGVGYRPALSPYLNLLRGGDTAANYYLGVVPENERRQNNRLFNSALNELDQKVTLEAQELNLSAPIESTGHITAFGNTGSYFGSTVVRPPASRTLPAPGKSKQ